MKLKTLVLAGGIAVALLAATPGSASANIMWCVGDPPTQVVTPAGNHVTVNTYIYAQTSHSQLNGLTTVTAVAYRNRVGGTRIVLTVHPPRSQYVTAISAFQRGRGDISTQASGSDVLTMVLDVPIA